MITLQGISKQYGGRSLFSDLSLHIGERDRIAVVGSNGAGKSTLMKMIAGLIESDTGRIARSRSTTTGYLPQEIVPQGGRSLFEEARLAFDEILALHRKMEETGREIEERSASGDAAAPGLPELLEEFGKLQDHVEHLEGYDIDVKVGQVLSGLGFRESDFGRRTDEFSGGWQMRIELAKLLLREPTVLMLDEPTNHLDIQSLEWLEAYLSSYEGTLILVSHDRRFLDNLVGRVVEISMGRVTEYSGNYSSYVGQERARRSLLEAAYRNQQQSLRQTLRFVERFRAKNTKASQVQSRLKKIEKIDLIEMEDDEAVIAFEFPEPPRAGRVVMQLGDVEKSYGSQAVFRGLSVALLRGDRAAVMGVNGSGKSTLIRALAGLEPFQGGQRVPGHNVTVSFYAQNQADELDPRKTVLETLEDVAGGEGQSRLRTLLGCFLFRDEDVFKPVSVLSGGEKSRLALARMLLTPANLLLFDEPTNHLDLRSKEVLKDALRRFPGACVIVSHDRDFLEGLVDRVWEVEDGKLTVHHGTVEEYLERRRGREDRAARPRDTAGREIRDRSPLHLEKARKRAEAEKRRERFRRLKPLKDDLDRVQGAIESAEKRKSALETMLADSRTYVDEKKARDTGMEYRQLTASLDGLYNRWTELQEAVEGIEKEP